MDSENELKLIRLLLIEDNPVDERLLRARLAEGHGVRFEIESTRRLDHGLERLRASRFDLVLLDLSLPDSAGSETIAQLHRKAPRIPILALTAFNNQEIMNLAVRDGAEDYLVKGTFRTDILVRAILYAIDRKRVRDELETARDSAVESARLRAEFLAIMSHEIRTPLNGIIGATRMLVDTRLSADQREMIEIARASAGTLLGITNDILDFSKISAGQTTLEETDFDLSVVVEGAVALNSEPASAKGIALDCRIDDDVPSRLRGDAGRLRQILSNVVGNAVKLTMQGAVTVRVGVVSEAENECLLRFEVRDTGIGIPLAGQRVIFDAFMQSDDSSVPNFGGTGLGLAIAAQLVELMGGSIGLQSGPGGGSNFWFTAPFRREEAVPRDDVADHPAALNGTPPSPVSPLAHRPVRPSKSGVPAEIRRRTPILLVEDDFVNRQVAMRMIETIGYRADAVDNGRAALEMLSRSEYAVILMDCQMPELDGYTATREIRRREGATRHTPIIGLTAHALTGDREICVRAGMDDYLTKPVTPEDLTEIIDKWVTAMGSLKAAAISTEGRSNNGGTHGSVGAARPDVTPAVDAAVLAELREYQKPGEADFVTELIGVFQDDLAVRLDQMKAGLQAGDAHQISQAAHALKGASGELGATVMREICCRLEMSTAGGSIVEAPAMMRELEVETDRVRTALAAHCVDEPGRGPVPGGISTE
jgi:signal transduction histidine kinase/HPt (histidine-containing phosphotransfer) domain-containing protein